MSEQPGSRNLTHVYADRIRTDLARVEAEIAETHKQLEQLATDRSWLLGLLGHLSTDTQTPGGESLPDGAPAPEEATAPEEPEAVSPAVIPAQHSNGDAPESGPQVPRKRRGGNGEATLRDLVVRFLSKKGEPTSVLEVAETLNSGDTSRQVSTVVVRNTLEALVARGIAERSKQGRSVFYTLLPAAGAKSKRRKAAKSAEAVG